MKKRIMPIIIILLTTIIATACIGPLRQPQPVTEEMFLTAAGSRGLEIESHSVAGLPVIYAILSPNAHIRFVVHPTDNDARSVYDFDVSLLDAQFSTRSSSSEVNILNHQSLRFTSGNTFVRIHRINNVIVSTTGPISYRNALNSFFDEIIVR